jgi:hypothetical protein
MTLSPESQARLKLAVQQFWGTRETQAQKQGLPSGSKDAGTRSAVTGGAQMNGFVNLVRDLLRENGLPEAHVHCEKHVELPGWYHSRQDKAALCSERAAPSVKPVTNEGQTKGESLNVSPSLTVIKGRFFKSQGCAFYGQVAAETIGGC